MGKSSAPPPPDYAAAAVAQGQANKDTAKFNAGANRVTQIAPQGTSTWTIRPGADLDNPQPGDYIQTTQLSPEQQSIYDQTAAIDNALLGTASRQLGRVDATFNSPLDLSSLPAWRTSGQGQAAPQRQQQAPAQQAAAQQAPAQQAAAGGGKAGALSETLIQLLGAYSQAAARGGQAPSPGKAMQPPPGPQPAWGGSAPQAVFGPGPSAGSKDKLLSAMLSRTQPQQ